MEDFIVSSGIILVLAISANIAVFLYKFFNKKFETFKSKHELLRKFTFKQILIAIVILFYLIVGIILIKDVFPEKKTINNKGY